MVTRRENESIDSLLRRFKKQVQNAGILIDYRNKQEFVGPSEKRRKKSEEARKRARKFQKKYNLD